MYCVFTVCLYVNVYKYMGLSIKWVSPYISHTHTTSMSLGPELEEVLKHKSRINLAMEYHALE